MNKGIFIIIFLAFFTETFSQRLSPEMYWVQLKDKEGINYSVDRPEEFLSMRAIMRRINAGIEITEEDFPVKDNYLDSIRSTGVRIHGASRWFNSIIIETTDSIALEKIAGFSFVSNFNTAYSNFTSGALEGDIDTGEVKMEEGISGSEFYGVTSSQISILSGNFLHNFGFRGNDVLIAVLDAGFYRVDELDAFSHLWEENRILAYKDFVDPESDFFVQSTHGLGVLSTMAAHIPDVFVGTAPEASYLLLRSEEAARENKVEEANWILAAEYADSTGADIITSSLGYYDFPTSEKMNYTKDDLTGDSALITRAAEKAFSKGMIVVSSAGNEGNDPWGKVTPPADGQNVIAVGAIDTSLNVAGFSSRGNTTDGRIKPDVMAVGFRTRIINPMGDPSYGYGTSFSAPQVAGLFACLKQAVPGKTNKEIIEAVRKSSSQYASPDSIKGFGIPNFIHALWELKRDDPGNENFGFIAYPNPFTRNFELQTTSSDIKIQQIDIFSPDGKLVYSNNKKWEPGELIRINSLQTHAPGVYYLVAKSTEGEIVTKLIKQ